MPRPVTNAATERWYASLPAFYRDDDAAADWPLLRYMGTIGLVLGELRTLHERLDISGPGDSSELADPVKADAAWLPWLALMVGARLPGTSVEDRRSAIAGAVGGWQAGTRAGILTAAKTALTGTRSVTLFDHWEGDPFAMSVATVEAETPDPAAVIAAVVAAGAKPAGVRLVHTYYASTWDVQESKLASWDAREAEGSWQRIQAVQP